MSPGRIHTALGKALRLSRSALGLSQEQVAAKANIHRTYYSSIERGERNPSLENLDRISRALGRPLWQLLKQAEDLI